MISVLKALADETRIKILEFLLVRERTVSEIVIHAGKAQPTISLHLKFLQMTNIVDQRKEGKFIFYRVKDGRVKKVLDILKNG